MATTRILVKCAWRQSTSPAEANKHCAKDYGRLPRRTLPDPPLREHVNAIDHSLL